MIEPNIYCKVCGMVMQCIADFQKENNKLPLVLEIGCADGQGVMRYGGFCRKVICIDPMVNGRPDIDSRTAEKLNVDIDKLNTLRRRVQDFDVSVIIGCSLWDEAFNKLKELLKDETIDILVVDGCHHPFEAVWNDYEKYSPLVTTGGYVIFDDTYEECIQQVVDKVLETGNYEKHDFFSIRKPDILQEVVALKKMK
jgi:cephalosporin hydroxylase